MLPGFLLLCLELEDLPTDVPKGAFLKGQFSSLLSSSPVPVVAAAADSESSPEFSVQLSKGFQDEMARSDDAEASSVV